MKVKILSPANSLISPSHCSCNTVATNRYDDEIISQEYLMMTHVVVYCMVAEISNIQIFKYSYSNSQII